MDPSLMLGVVVRSSKMDDGECLVKHTCGLSKLYMGVKLDPARSNTKPDSQSEVSFQLK